MTMEEAHIKAQLEYAHKCHNGVYLSIETSTGDDFHIDYEIRSDGDYEGYDVIGRGHSWEETFEQAETQEKDRIESEIKYQAMIAQSKIDIEASLKTQKKDKREKKLKKQRH